jgi:hypothetical protein
MAVLFMQAYTKLLMKKRLHVNASLATLLLKGKGKSSIGLSFVA